MKVSTEEHLIKALVEEVGKVKSISLRLEALEN